ncbi:MAG TPA: hypothetical protein IAC86_07125 [Candidatus Cryptobacteroides excrementigallinarum]|nr:hypothetical protein [Candidatus Cryptobacteroides excrementigallinarum]
MKANIFYITVIAVLSGCVNNMSLDSEKAVIMAKLSLNPEYSPKVEDSYVPGNYGAYKDYFVSTDNLVGISSSKLSPLDESRVFVYSGPTFITETKASTSASFVSSVNGMDLRPEVGAKSDNRDFKSLFGSDVSFSIESEVLTKTASENNEVSISLYVPEEIVITVPKVSSTKEMLPLCYYDGFQVHWNEDSYNENGVLAIIEWTGDMVLGADFPSTYIRRICIFDDSGSGVLPRSMFEGIPDAAVCSLALIRGVTDIVSVNGETCKLMAESHEYMPFILVREIRNKR